MVPLLLPLLIRPALALDLEPVMEVDIAASYFDEGAKVAAYPGVKTHLWGDEDSLLFGSTFLRLDAVAAVTPSYGRLGPRLTFSPIAIFEVSGWYLPSVYFGTFSSIKGFDDPAAVYTDQVLDGLDRGSGYGALAGGNATLQLKVWNIVGASWVVVQQWGFKASDKVSGDYWWEPESELLMAFRDTTWGLNGVLLYEHVIDADLGRKVYVGGAYGDGQAVATGDRFARAGLLANFSLNERWGFLLLAQAYLDDRVYTSPLPPYLALRARWTMPR